MKWNYDIAEIPSREVCVFALKGKAGIEFKMGYYDDEDLVYYTTNLLDFDAIDPHSIEAWWLLPGDDEEDKTESPERDALYVINYYDDDDMEFTSIAKFDDKQDCWVLQDTSEFIYSDSVFGQYKVPSFIKQ